MVLAVFERKADAEAYCETMNRRKKRRGAYEDVVVLPARAIVRVANSYDVKAGRATLDGEWS